MADLATDLRKLSRVSTTGRAESALTSSLRKSSDFKCPWIDAAEKLEQFPTSRCVQMLPADWQELSGVLSSITRLCATSKPAVNPNSTTASPGFVAFLELLLRLGRVTSCLLCVNGDDRSFSIARVAQAIRTTTSVLSAAIAQASPAGLPAEVADSLARQRCEQTPLLSAVAWALRQEARGLFFNPRPTALSLGTALLDFFRVVEQLWPQGIFVPQQHEAALDAAAARMADPAAQLAMAMLRCAGRAMAEIGPGACRESLLCGLRVAYDMVQQVSLLLDAGLIPADEALVKQLQESPSLPQLMLALLAVETYRLHQQLGVSETDSCILLQPRQKRRTQDQLSRQHSKRQSRSSCAGEAAAGEQPQLPPPAQQQLLSSGGSAGLSNKCTSAGATCHGKVAGAQPQQQQQQQQQDLLKAPATAQLYRTLSQQQPLQQQQIQQQQQQAEEEEEEHAEIEGAGELHQVWHQVLGMARKNLARDEAPETEHEETPRSPLMQMWVSLGLPEALLQLAADAGVSPASPTQQYVAVCRVGKFLLQGSPLLQPQHKAPQPQRTASPSAAAGQVGTASSLQRSTSAAGRAAAGQLSPFAPQAAVSRALSRSLSGKPAAIGGQLPQPWQHGSPGTAGGSITADSPGGGGGGGGLSGAPSLGDSLVSPAGFSSSGLQGAGAAAHALSVSAEAAEQLMESCRDFGLRGQEELELLRLQRVVPVVLLNTAACLLERQASLSAGASASAAADTDGTAKNNNNNSSKSKLASRAAELEVVHAACTAAACVSRCWPVLQKVAAQQEELCDLLAECQPPAGVFAGLTTVCWRPYTLPSEVRLPLLQLLQLVVKLVWQLQPSWQQQQQRHNHSEAGALLLLQRPPSLQDLKQNGQGQAGGQVLSPEAGECIDALLEVLTAVSKLPWEPEAGSSHEHHHSSQKAAAAPGPLQDDARSDVSSSAESATEADAQLVAEAWQQECQPVAAAVEACLRTAAQVAAAADGAVDWQPVSSGGNGLTATSAAAAAGRKTGSAARPKAQRHPSAVALGSCLASLCAPFGRPGPLVAAAAAAQPGGPEQQQLFALLLSKLKVLLYNPASNKAALIAMHPIEQTPIYFIHQLRSRPAASSVSALGPTLSSVHMLAGAPGDLSAATVPWLLLLSRLMVLRGKLLGHLLTHEADEAGRGRATGALHNAYWHVTMAHDSASTLAAHWELGSSTQAASAQQQHQQELRSELQLQLLPSLKQAVQVLKAAMKLSRHYHETGFASGFAAGFAAGYAAAVAAASGVHSSAAAAPGPVSFASPWGVLQQSCIRSLPQQLESVGSRLAWQLRHLGCSNPLCVNLSLGSELWLLPAQAEQQQQTGSCAGGGDLPSCGDDGVAASADATPLCYSCRQAAQGPAGTAC